MNDNYIKFELCRIDAWITPEGLWEWNASYRLEDGLVFHESALTPRIILKKLREWEYLSKVSKGRLTILYDGDIYQICNRHTDEPIFALIPMS